MIRSFGLTIISAALLVQMFIIHERVRLSWITEKSHPQINLPTASSYQKVCFRHRVPQLSLSRQGTWIAEGHEPMNDHEAKKYILNTAAKMRAKGYTPVLRFRIGAKEKAARFITMATHAQKTGYAALYVAVLPK